MPEKEKEKKKTGRIKPVKGFYLVRLDPELIEVMDSLSKKLNLIAYDSLDNVSYAQLSRILARKIKESGLLDK